MSGEGTSCGSRCSPISRNPTKPTNSTKGINKFLFMLFNGGRCSSRRDLYDFRFFGSLSDFLLRERVPSIANGKRTTNRHQQRAAPNPIHQRLVINAHRPAAVFRGVAERKIEITPDAAIDRGLRSRLLGRIEYSLL